ncbi:MAG TPA: hypothetical protein VL361_27765 [Candidatus Limnocylindrales bacterium]|jgi:ElaB/YqjD/DUF883 family membrane-anchored ribosome-binding protein|nr:hypothetical protein [Candidatus Limnocylindrales bacterium]
MNTREHPDNEASETQARLSAVIDKAQDLCERLQNQTTAAAKATDRAVREHPYQAVGVAFGVGLLLGIVMARSRD